MTEIARNAPTPARARPPRMSLPARLCLALVKPVVNGPLRRFNSRLRPIGQRYESYDNYQADRLESMDEYRELLHPHCSFEGKTVGGVVEWAADAGVPHVAVIAGQVSDEAREELAVRANVQVLALTDRVWQGGEAFARAGVLVEEAALEAARLVTG